jgi:hypothetical protein
MTFQRLAKEQAVATMSGGKYLCIEHLPDALIRCGDAALLAPKMRNATPKIYFSKEDFLIACKEQL